MAAADGGAPRLEIRSDRLLLVEGRDEENLFEALLRHCFGPAASEDIQIIPAGGKHRFRKNLTAIAAAARARPTLRAVGAIRDADDNALSAFQSVCDALRHAGYDPPSAHGQVSVGDPPVGVFILPDGTGAGAIETLCRRSVAGNEASRCVEAYIDCLKDRGALRSRNEDKTFAHAWLAGTNDPVARVGEGARQGVWDFDSDAFAEIASFIRKLP
ncbi:MAG: hypothetical protein OXE57_20640 [Alphaproteobacteria bacterium]|nr:hypothetical protein [Alphaproteobacteria bacterium]